MNVTVIGTGTMARAVATRALAGGPQVTFVGTHISKADDLVDELRSDGPVRSSEELDGDLVVLAVPFTQAPHAVRQHFDELAGRVLVDVTNPIDLSVIEPLDTAPFLSGAALIADGAPPDVPVVKAFNTAFAGTLMAGEVAGRRLDVYLAGDDADAKAKVAQLAEDGGLRPIDAGGLARARELEALGLLHMAVQPALGTAFASAVAVLP
jgi:8-hydroxy-5-deazaflavin:NADPH oxidoreductase